VISDNVPLFGTRRKSWLVLMGLIQFTGLIIAATTAPKDPLVFTALLCMASLATAFINVVSDAIMVIQARKDKAFGSQDFVALMSFAGMTGSAIGCIYAGLMTQYVTPLWALFGYSFFGLITAIFACLLNKNAELDQAESPNDSDISTS
jgi:MFS family permease